MYGETVSGRPSAYPGCGKELAEGYENTVAFMNRLHAESMELFAKLSDEDLQKKWVSAANEICKPDKFESNSESEEEVEI